MGLTATRTRSATARREVPKSRGGIYQRPGREQGTAGGDEPGLVALGPCCVDFRRYAFFNDVMVMAEDIALRNNRLALLSSLHGMMNRVADISKLAA